MDFGKNFVWGAATASYQVEGGAYEDGKGLNIFDTFCQIPGRIDNNDNGDIACDHYHRWKDDIAVTEGLQIFFKLGKNSSGGYRKSQSKRN